MFSLKAKLIVLLVYTGLIVVGAGLVVRHWDKVQYLELKAEIDKANLDAANLALERDQAFQRLGDAQALAYHANLEKQAAVSRALKLEVKKHVSNSGPRGCVTVGLVRLLDAAGKRVSADSLPLPSGLTDDACAPMGTADVAERLISNIANFHANAGQLDALEASARELRAAADKLQPRR